jgi:hypothetical protein
VRYTLAPGHVVRWAEHPAAEDIDVFSRLSVPDAQVGDVDVEEYPLRGGDVGVPSATMPSSALPSCRPT